MRNKKNLIISVLLIFALLMSNLATVMAEEQSVSIKKIYKTQGYTYTPKWNEEIKKVNEVTSEMNYEFKDNVLLGELSVLFKNDDIKIPFKLVKDEDNSNLYHGRSEFKHKKDLKNVELAIETNGDQIERISLLIDKEIAYSLGNNTSFDEMMKKVSERKETSNTNTIRSKQLETLSATVTASSSVTSDGAIIGSGSGGTYDDIYAHTTIKTLSTGEEGWMATRVYTTKNHTLSHITKVVISGTKSGSAYDLLYVRPSGTRSSSTTITQYAFYWALGYYLGISLPVQGYNGTNSSSDWEHTYTMWDDWNNHIFTDDLYDDNGIVSDVRLEKLTSGWVSGNISVDVTEYMTAAGYFYHDLDYTYSK